MHTRVYSPRSRSEDSESGGGEGGGGGGGGGVGGGSCWQQVRNISLRAKQQLATLQHTLYILI